ncbi:DUF4345 domain-containing protein [Altererythrobacter indicus]|uniref:DUF4345 domain-containing protein n=1 Tax=Altericroceibacterium indicum TaxID=374177 RepID=A0A845AHP8_9SPHN|nr:DUF4345 family protein [Altericroceibacterium indicum]MXP26638.1 DUF4345 domain-containing protein [Altericroceibacterium indicum]
MIETTELGPNGAESNPAFITPSSVDERETDMIRLLLTAIILLAGIFFTIAGIGFLVDPAASAASLGVQSNNVAGLATLRAETAAFFLVAGLCMIWGAWKRNGEILLAPAAMCAIAFVGRLLGAMIDGSYDAMPFYLAGDLTLAIIIFAGSKLLPHETVG